MKKLIPILALAAGAAAFVAYKMKKDEKKVMELDEGLLYDDEDTIEESLISEPQTVGGMENEYISTDSTDTEQAILLYDDQYKNLSQTKVEEIKRHYEESLEKLAVEGDVHENERPIEHTVTFLDKVNQEAFKHAVVNRGFVISVNEQDDKVLNILHISAVNSPKLLDNILFLNNEALAHHGVYSGWKTKVMY